MDNEEIKLKLLNSAMKIAERQSWSRMSLVEAAQEIELPIQTARQLFPCKASLLLYLNRLADESALAQPYNGQPVSEYLFDSFMNRFDVFQDYKTGFVSALNTLPFNPALTLIMGIATKNSMKWIAEAAQINISGIKGIACIKGLTAIWAFNMRVWIKDDTQDLSQTMASLDKTIKQAGKFAPYFVVKNKEASSTTNPETQDEPFVPDQK